MQNDNPIRNKQKVPHAMSVCCTGGILEGRIALRFAFKVELLKKKKKRFWINKEKKNKWTFMLLSLQVPTE